MHENGGRPINVHALSTPFRIPGIHYENGKRHFPILQEKDSGLSGVCLSLWLEQVPEDDCRDDDADQSGHPVREQRDDPDQDVDRHQEDTYGPNPAPCLECRRSMILMINRMTPDNRTDCSEADYRQCRTTDGRKRDPHQSHEDPVESHDGYTPNDLSGIGVFQSELQPTFVSKFIRRHNPF